MPRYWLNSHSCRYYIQITQALNDLNVTGSSGSSISARLQAIVVQSRRSPAALLGPWCPKGVASHAAREPHSAPDRAGCDQGSFDDPKWDTKKRGKFKTIGSQFLVENIKAAYEDTDIIWYNYINMQGQNQHQLLRTVESPSTQSMSVWASGLPRPDPSTAWTWVSHGPAVIFARKKNCYICPLFQFLVWPEYWQIFTAFTMYCIFLHISAYFCIFLHTCFGQGNLDTGMATTLWILWYMLIHLTDNRGWKSIKTSYSQSIDHV